VKIRISFQLVIEEGLDEDRISFNVATFTNFPVPNNDGYDLGAYFDLHDLEDPNDAAASTLKRTKPEGRNNYDSRIFCK
jgi:hypothetical protein